MIRTTTLSCSWIPSRFVRFGGRLSSRRYWEKELSIRFGYHVARSACMIDGGCMIKTTISMAEKGD